jgi:splicing factor U2AF subunit
VQDEVVKCGHVLGIAIPIPPPHVADSEPCRVYVKFNIQDEAKKCKVGGSQGCEVGRWRCGCCSGWQLWVALPQSLLHAQLAAATAPRPIAAAAADLSSLPACLPALHMAATATTHGSPRLSPCPPLHLPAHHRR